jgi:putative endopeptidase
VRPVRPVRYVLLCLLCIIAGSTRVATARSAPQIAPWGVYLGYLDTSVKPGHDFFAYANGAWLKTAEIAPDRPSAGAGFEVNKMNEDRLKEIVAGLRSGADADVEERKLRDLYDSYMDEAKIEADGLAPAKADLDRIAAVKSHADVVRLMGAPSLRLDGPFGMVIGVDDKHPDAYAVFVFQSGLALPDRDYYLREDAALQKTREAYHKYLVQMLGFAGVKDAEPRAAAILALEHDLAAASWPAADRREAEKVYNPMSLASLKKLAPEFPWEAYLEAGGISLRSAKGDRTLIVGEKTAFPALSKAFAKTPVSVWRDYLTVRYLHAFSPFLPKAVDDADFALYGTTLQGRTKQLERTTRGARLLDQRMGEALGKIYVKKYFPPEAKEKVQTLVKNLLQAMREDLVRLDWMTDATRKKAQEKLEKFTMKVGYPDKWRDYSSLEIRRGDLIGSVKNANVFAWERHRKRLDDKVDRTEWGMSPPTVNAYYNSSMNEIVFPAGILQPPFFDPAADDAANYGAIGAVIGHEISHGFDDQGSKYDGLGVLRMWWTEADRKKFDERTGALASQYDEYEPLPGMKVNGRLTLGENIADLAGLAIARKAYHISLGGNEAPVLDGYTGDQRFYIAYAQAWRGKQRDESMRQRILSNPHSPNQYRVNGVVRNDDGWYAAFPNVKPGDPYYLPPEKRVRLW